MFASLVPNAWESLRAFVDPVYLIVYMLEKARAISLLKTFEDLSDVVFGDHWSSCIYVTDPLRQARPQP